MSPLLQLLKMIRPADVIFEHFNEQEFYDAEASTTGFFFRACRGMDAAS